MSKSRQLPICLLFGANGQVGFELRRSLALDYNVLALSRELCDMSDAQQICQAIQFNIPALIVNAAAYTAVDKAESEPELAFAINAKALEVIAVEAKKINAVVVHYSTDYVFSGEASHAYVELDAVGSRCVYGQSKFSGEQSLLRILGEDYPCWIIRTSWVYGLHGANFLKTMLKLASTRNTLSVVSDQIGAPTSAALIADVTSRILKISPKPGIYHLSAAGQTSWYEYAKHVIARATYKNMLLCLTEQQIVAIDTASYPTAAKRPAFSLLNCSKLENALSIRLPDWRFGVDQTVDIIVENK